MSETVTAQGDTESTAGLTADPVEPNSDEALQETAAPDAEGAADEGDQSTKAEEEGEKEGEGEKAGAPEEYAEFKTPDGVDVNDAVLQDFKAFAKDLNLTQEQAQKVVDLQAAMISQANDQFVKTVNGWTEALPKDAEYGGEKFNENLGIANKAYNSGLVTPELRVLLEDNHLAKHPDVVRLFYRIGTKMGESAYVSGNASGDTKTRAQRLYPSMNE